MQIRSGREEEPSEGAEVDEGLLVDSRDSVGLHWGTLALQPQPLHNRHQRLHLRLQEPAQWR